MRIGHILSETQREISSGMADLSQALLIKAGFVQYHETGVYTLLPLGSGLLTNIKKLIMDSFSSLEPVELVFPSQLNNKKIVSDQNLNPPIEINEKEVLLPRDYHFPLWSQFQQLSDILTTHLFSYRKLPLFIQHFSLSKSRNFHAPLGLFGPSETKIFGLFNISPEHHSLSENLGRILLTSEKVFKECGVSLIKAFHSFNLIKKNPVYTWCYPANYGPDVVLRCENCGYTAMQDVAVACNKYSYLDDQKPMERVYTPGIKTIQNLSDFLSIPDSKLAKSVFVTVKLKNVQELKIIYCMIRGDKQLSFAKLISYLEFYYKKSLTEYRFSNDEEIKSIGSIPGFASPIGTDRLKYTLVVDHSVSGSSNLVTGANEQDYHQINSNFARDYVADIEGDISLVTEGNPCPVCNKPLRAVNSFIISQTFTNEDLPCEYPPFFYNGLNGRKEKAQFCFLYIDLFRLIACVADKFHNQTGLIWPKKISPFLIHLLFIPSKKKDVYSVAENIYINLRKMGFSVLFDDRNIQVGIKFNDSDLIGLPVRMVVSEKTLENDSVEVKFAGNEQNELISLDGLYEKLELELTEAL